jgi:hypothetical protein
MEDRWSLRNVGCEHRWKWGFQWLTLRDGSVKRLSNKWAMEIREEINKKLTIWGSSVYCGNKCYRNIIANSNWQLWIPPHNWAGISRIRIFSAIEKIRRQSRFERSKKLVAKFSWIHGTFIQMNELMVKSDTMWHIYYSSSQLVDIYTLCWQISFESFFFRQVVYFSFTVGTA